MSIKLLQWNVWYKEDPNNVIKQLKEIDADILCLQELTIGSSLHSKVDVVQLVKDELGYEVYFKDMVTGNDGAQANAIFSKYPIKDSKFIWINEPAGSGGYDDEYRCYIEVDIVIGGKKLTVGTTHMSYMHRFEETERKLLESNKLIDQIKNKESYVFTGDLNVAPDSKTIKIISDVLKNAGPIYSEPTWTTKPFSYDGFKAETLDWRLDYAFSSTDINVKKASVISTDYSDHLPILIEIGH